MFSEGDTVTISRGKDRGQATIVAAAENGQYAVKTAEGNLRVLSADSLKAPAESTIGEGKLAAEIQTLISDTDGYDRASLQAFIQRLSGDMPGLGARISWPAEKVADS